MAKCVKYPCDAKIKKYAYYVGKDGPFCKSCAQFVAHFHKLKIKKEETS